MSLFSLFRSSSSRYPTDRHFISRQELKYFFQKNRWSSVSEAEEGLVENSLLSARDSQGKISLRRAYDTLRRLENKGKISPNDRKILMRDLAEYLEKKFSD